MKTPISYYGGKQGMIKYIREVMPDWETYDNYTEVFFGGGTVFFDKKPSKNETINDRLDVVVNFYEQVKLNYDEVKKLVEASLFSKTQHRRSNEIIRKHAAGKKVDKILLTWAFWYCANNSFSHKLTGYSGVKSSNYQDSSPAQTLRNKKALISPELVRRLEDAFIDNRDAIVVLESRNVRSAFHYLDPPYIAADQGHYNGYGTEEFEKLLKWLQDKCKGKFLLSNYNSDILEEYIQRNGWRKKEIDKRIMAPKNRWNAKKREVLTWNYRESKQVQMEM